MKSFRCFCVFGGLWGIVVNNLLSSGKFIKFFVFGFDFFNDLLDPQGTQHAFFWWSHHLRVSIQELVWIGLSHEDFYLGVQTVEADDSIVAKVLRCARKGLPFALFYHVQC